MDHIETYLDSDIDGVPSNHSEELFAALDKCKATGNITSITTPINLISGCYNLRIELQDGISTYGIYWIWNNSSCHARLWYNLSWNNFPKIWEHLSVIAEISTNYIVKIWDVSYNENITLPNCVYYYENIIGWIVNDSTENDEWKIKWDSKNNWAPDNIEIQLTNSWTHSEKIISPIIVNEKVTEVLSHTWIQNIENSLTLSTTNIEVNSWNLSQNQIENHENIKEVEITSNTETINIIEKSTQKIDSSFYIIWWIIFLIIIWVWIFKIYKKK